MKTNQNVNADQEVGNERGRAHLRAVQSQGLTSLQLQLKGQEKSIPPGVDKTQALRIRGSLMERLGEQLERVLTAIQTMAKSSAPHIRRFYEEILKKRVFTEENMKALAEIAKSSWGVLKTLFSWTREMCKRNPGTVGAVAGGIFGLKTVGLIAGLLASIPFIGAKLAGIATLVGIVGGAYYGYKVAMSLHGHWFRKEVVAQQSGMQEQLDEIQSFLGSSQFKEA